MFTVSFDNGTVKTVDPSKYVTSNPFGDNIETITLYRYDVIEEEGLVAEIAYNRLPTGSRTDRGVTDFSMPEQQGVFDPSERAQVTYGCSVMLIHPREIARAEKIWQDGTLIGIALGLPGNRHMTMLYKIDEYYDYYFKGGVPGVSTPGQKIELLKMMAGPIFGGRVLSSEQLVEELAALLLLTRAEFDYFVDEACLVKLALKKINESRKEEQPLDAQARASAGQDEAGEDEMLIDAYGDVVDGASSLASPDPSGGSNDYEDDSLLY